MTNEAGQHTDGPFDGGNGVGGGLGYSIRPGLPVPETVLVVEMGNGALLLHGWRDGPTHWNRAARAPRPHRPRLSRLRSPGGPPGGTAGP